MNGHSGSDRAEVAKCLAYLAAATGKQPTRETLEVYFELLADLSPEVLRQAARLAITHHQYATIPPVAKLREIAAEIQGKANGITAMEGLSGLRRLIRDHGGAYASPEDRAKARAKMPPVVSACLDAFGWDAFCSFENPEVLQAQWRMNWERVEKRHQQQAATPENLRIGGNRSARIDSSNFGRITN